MINRKGPEPQFVISAVAPAPGCNVRLTSPGHGSKHCCKSRNFSSDPEPDPQIRTRAIEVLRSLKCGHKIIELFNSAIFSEQIELTDNCIDKG